MEYSIADNYHQAVMGGTGANHIMIGTGDVYFFNNSCALPAPSTAVASPKTSNRDFDPPAATRAASIVSHPSTDAARLILRSRSTPHNGPPCCRRRRKSLIAVKMKIGVELMTYGEVASARVMFQRAAEAGDGAGAFALAET
jgi:hypothetical protein